MSLLELAFLGIAGFVAGLVGYVTGLASVVSYPALLAVGLPPLSANVTNTVSLVTTGVGSMARSDRVLLDGDRRPLYIGIGCALIGGSIGAVALLMSPPEAFEAIVPYLVAMAAVALLCQPALRRWATRHEDRPWIWLLGVVLISVYGGYFGAGAGILFLALALVVTDEPLWRATLLKSALLGVANLVAALGFAFFGPVHWGAAVAMGVGCFVGGWCGPPVVRMIPATALRVTVGIGGLGLAMWLALG